MKVMIIRDYFDSTKNNELIKAGTELTVSAERGKVLVEATVAEEIKEIKPIKENKKNK